jgi:tetratricopeptide (TPR) repeat protein
VTSKKPKKYRSHEPPAAHSAAASSDTRLQAFQNAFEQGTRLLHAGQPGAARPLLEQAHALAPAHVDAAINLGGAYILLKQWRKAVAVLELLSAQAPDHAMVWTNLGAAYLGNPVLAQDADQQRALAAFKRALEINPAAPNVAYNIGLIYRDRNELDDAMHWFQQAIRHNPGDQDAHSLLRRLQDRKQKGV